ncbi:MAG: histidine ammonia-lyase [Chloroflexi bacterium]|nr:histidine ammonia-lyase [Chloroflexota bacterium]
MTQPLLIDGHSLTIADVVAVARQHRPVQLAPVARERMQASRAYVESLLTPDAPTVYGINTGFGVFADRKVSPADSAQLSRNLVISHAVCTGEPFAEDVTRAAMLIRANTLAIGHSGARPRLVETLLAMLNAGVHPIVPQQGSLGSSGDLAPLCHLALIFMEGANAGEAIFRGQRMSGKEAMDAAGLPQLTLEAKEGLAISNGATFSAAVAALAVTDGATLLTHSQIATAFALEALLGVSSAFDERLHSARRQSGQSAVAANLRKLIKGSTLVDSSGRVQDPYSLRCAPQIIGPVLDTLALARGWIENEINAATDNPLLFREPDNSFKAISGGNFHGEIIGLGMDYLGIAIAELGALAEQQISRLINEKLSFGLPPMLLSNSAAPGLNSGLMMPHYTAVSLALENQTLAHPDSVHSLPTSAGQEDHNANALTAARHASQIIANVAHILAIQFFVSAQAVDLRSKAMPEKHVSPAVAVAHARLRRDVPFVEHDRFYQADIERARALILNGEIAQATGLER